MIQLPLDDFAASLQLMRSAMASDVWTERLPYIRAAKQRILNEHQLLPVLARVVRGDRLANALTIKVINLDRRTDRFERFEAHVRARTSARLQARITRRAISPRFATRTLRILSAIWAAPDQGSIWKRGWPY
jgi:peptidoglycan hydrolase-like amidase